MARFSLVGASVLALGLLVGSCFGPAIAGRQFSYRDAAHFYYPLYQRVEAEWNAGRVPLWEPEENAGMPLLGNPTAAVLYPGKLIYRILPYPLAARVYVIAHTLLAFAGMVVLARAFGIGRAGGVIAGLSYAFAAPILCQYCNIIYLVGAAWVPWAFLAIDAWLRRGSRSAIAGLGAVLALQVLGGDPQAAYIEGLCGGAYAILLGRRAGERPPMPAWMKAVFLLLVLVALGVWVGVTLDLAHRLPPLRGRKDPPIPTFVWNKYLPLTVAGLWASAGMALLFAWSRGNEWASRLGKRLAGLAGAALLAGLLSGAQLLPVLEFSGLTGRAADEGTHDIYPFSVEPCRVAEFLWPYFFGSIDQGNRSWLALVPPKSPHRLWVPSLYAGGLTLALALSCLGARGGPAWRGWIVGIAGVTLLAAIGEHAGPLWVARNFDSMTPFVGTHDPLETNAIRLDGQLRDGDGSFYYLLSAAIPGFQQFRYPSKLLTFTVLALALLAGHGWDRVASGSRRGLWIASGVLLGLSLGAAAGLLAARGPIVARFTRAELSTGFGPFEPRGAWTDMFLGTVQGGATYAAAIVAALLARRRPGTAAACVIVAVAIDLALANSRLVVTAEQAEFDRVPRALEIIAEAEKADPAPGPYRIHRTPVWSPESWRRQPSRDRVNDFLRWERDTIQPKYAIPYGVRYTYTMGVAELYDYEFFFGPFTIPTTPEMARRLGLEPGERPVYVPRRAFDLWNTRYFILPGYPVWTHSERGILSLVNNTVRVYPRPDAFDGADGNDRQLEWWRNEDMQIVRNPNAMPRAWVVHEARFLVPIVGKERTPRARPMEEMLYAGDGIWQDQDRTAYDPRSLAWIESDAPNSLVKYRAGRVTLPSEAVTVREVSPVRTELDVTLERPGFVILADAFYPGWTLTVDGKAAPILRANRMMRGAALDAGRHTLVYEYWPRSFLVGLVLSAIGLLGLAGSLVWAVRGQTASLEKDRGIGESGTK
jgi:hypothetical protein